MGTATFTDWLTQQPDEWGNLQGTTPPTLTVDSDGLTSLDVNVATTGTSAAKLGGLGVLGKPFGGSPMSLPISYERIYFKWETNPAANDEMIHIIADQVNEKCTIRINSAGHLNFYQGNGGGTFTLVSTMMTALAQDTWYRIEFQCGTGNPAFWEILLALGDGPIIETMNGVNTLGGPTSAGSFQTIWGKERDFNGNSVHWKFRDFFWTDQGYPGPGHCVALLPTMDGFYGNGTPHGAGVRWACLTDLPPDDDTSYVNGLSNGQAYTARTAGGLRGAINSVKSYSRARSDDGVTNIMWNTRLRSGAVDSDTGNNGLSDLTYISRQKIFDTDPATGKPWTNSGLNAAQVGFIQNTSAMRATSAYVMVDYLAAPAAQLVNGKFLWALKQIPPIWIGADILNSQAAYHPGVTVPRADMVLHTAGLTPPFSLGYFRNAGSQQVTVKDDATGNALATVNPGVGAFVLNMGQGVPVLSGSGVVEYCIWK